MLNSGIPRVVNGVKLYHSLEEDFSVYESVDIRERILAFVVDYFLFGLTITILRLPFLRIIDQATLNGQTTKGSALSFFLFILALGISQLGPLCLWGRTLGMHFFGIRLVTLNGGEKLDPSRIFMREILGKLISVGIFGMGFFFPIWRLDRRALHDVISDTKLVKYRA